MSLYYFIVDFPPYLEIPNRVPMTVSLRLLLVSQGSTTFPRYLVEVAGDRLLHDPKSTIERDCLSVLLSARLVSHKVINQGYHYLIRVTFCHNNLTGVRNSSDVSTMR